jgi:hypothetical protein
MDNLKPSHVLSGFLWFFFFIFSIGVFMRQVPADKTSYTFIGVFFFLAVWTSAIAQGRPKIKDLRVKVGDKMYTQESGAVEVFTGTKGATIVHVNPRKSEDSDRPSPPAPDKRT